jgi:hypothetical protein
MPQVLVHFDEATLHAIDRVAPVARRQRADFIRKAVKDALFLQQIAHMREACRLQPDHAEAADVRELPEEWKERVSSKSGEPTCLHQPACTSLPARACLHEYVAVLSCY